MEQHIFDHAGNVVLAKPTCSKTIVQLLLDQLGYFFATTELLSNLSRQTVG